MSCALLPPDVALCIQDKEFNFHLIRPQNLLPHALRVFHVPFYKLQVCCLVPFSQEQLPSGSSLIKLRFVKCCRDCCSSGRFSHLSQGTLQFCQRGHWVLGHLPVQGPSCPIAQFGRTASSRKSLCGSIFIPFPDDGAHCALGNFQHYKQFYTFPQIYASSQFYLGVLRTVPWTSWQSFCSDMHCQLWDLVQKGVFLSKSCPIN